jgi:hypothetical protein
MKPKHAPICALAVASLSIAQTAAPDRFKQHDGAAMNSQLKQHDYDNGRKLSRDEVPAGRFDRLTVIKDGFVNQDDARPFWKAR